MQVERSTILNEPNSFYLTETQEDLLFRNLLGEYKKDNVCRFTTINSIFRTCNEKAQSMCCIVCMNDKSETDYATQKLNLTIQNDSEEINSFYILSCCDIDSKNNFTMWRLYADDARGVCIENTKDNFTGDFFLLFNKKCIPSEPKDYGMNEHPSFQRRWSYESGFGIITPIVNFSIENNNDQFPMILNKITFGPKAKEVDVNIDQLTYLIEIKGIKHTNIGNDLIAKSNIKHYR